MPVFRHAGSQETVYGNLVREDGSTVVLQPDETIELDRDPEIPSLPPDPEEEADGNGFCPPLPSVDEPDPELEGDPLNLKPTPAQERTERRAEAAKPAPVVAPSAPTPAPSIGTTDPA